MLAACFFCDYSLGTNDEIEQLPVGRRLAFDESKGRLWVVCPACGRWNLTPIDERWEAIEACEKAFRATHLRLQTDQIGLARLRSGLDLVRIGRPILPEFAAWRYGNELLRRRRRALVRRFVPRLGPTGLLLATPLVALGLGTGLGLLYGGAAVAYARLRRQTALSLPLTTGDALDLTHEQVDQAELIRAEDEDDQWAMWVGCSAEDAPRGARIEETVVGPRALLTGHDGRMAAARILPHLNPAGGTREGVNEAVRWLEAVGGSERALHSFARSRYVRPVFESQERTLTSVHPEARLALEMALHEEEERRTLRGELTILRWAWQREESVAAIADRLATDPPALGTGGG
ncbi:MAG: hypothetical protein AB7R55_08580 [Gemmatimonadales bacterium]